MKRIPFKTLLLFCIPLILPACSSDTVSEKSALVTIAPESELAIASSISGVSEFKNLNKDFVSDYDNDQCYNITPDFIADNSDFMIFKYDKSCETFIMYDNEIYSIGICFGGWGITSMALADLNEDGQYELYYTFSWGSGIHCSQTGYFDAASKEITVFDYSYAKLDSDMMLTMNKTGDLCVNSAAIDGSFVDFSIKANELLGSIAFEENEITARFKDTSGRRGKS